MPLGILKSEFNWKNLSLERVFFSFTVCLIVNACCKYGKKQCSLFLPNYIIYFIRIEFSIFNAILVFFFSTQCEHANWVEYTSDGEKNLDYLI